MAPLRRENEELRATHERARREHAAEAARWATQLEAKRRAAQERDVALQEVSTIAMELDALQAALRSP